MVKKRFYFSIIIIGIMLLILFSNLIDVIFNNSISVEGVVKKYNDSNAVIEYSVNGEKQWYKVNAPNYEDGEKVIVKYEKDNIREVSLDKKTNFTFWIVMIILVCVVFSPFIYEYIIYCNIIKTGTKIEVDYVETEAFINNGSLNAYVMKFKWTNPENNEIYNLINEEFTNFDPKDIIKEKNVTKFTAYINLKHPRQYRVMLDELLKDTYINKEKIIMM